MKKRFLALIVVTVTLLAGTTYAGTANMGNDMSFQKIRIYGSKYTLLATGRICYSPYSKINVIVDNMYKTDGSSSNYSNSRWAVVRASSGAILVDNVKVTKGVTKSITISSAESAGINYGVNVKGDTAGADALISGAVNGFNKAY